jgi:hypothetical protein
MRTRHPPEEWSRELHNQEANVRKAVSVFALWLACTVPALACDKPTPPAALPDGKTASKEDMLAAKKQVDAFKRDMDAYMSCERNSSKLDFAQKQLEQVADRFNVEVRAFKQRG